MVCLRSAATGCPKNKPKTLSYRCVFEKCNKCTFLLKNLQSLSYECTGIPDFELTSVRDTRTHPLKEMLTHLNMSNFLLIIEKVLYLHNFNILETLG